MSDCNKKSTVLGRERQTRAGDPQDDRLWAAMLDAQRRLDTLTLTQKRIADDPIVKACRECLQCAVNEAAVSRYVAWDCLHRFDAEFLSSMSHAELKSRWCVLRAEAKEKLKGWRNEAADCLVKAAKEPGPTDHDRKHCAEETPVPLHLVADLQRQLVIVSQNQQHKLELFEQSLPLVTISLTAAVAIAFAFSLAVFGTERFSFLLPWAQAVALGIPAGVLGGIVSMSFSLGRVDLKAKIPETRLSRQVTRIRPLLGGTVAIPILVFVHAGYVKVSGFEDGLAIFAFCFLGGFSERWFLSVMERFEGAKK